MDLDGMQFTLYFYNDELSKNKRFLTLLSSLARYSQKPRLKRIFEIMWVHSEKISVPYSDWPKSWIWRTVGHVRDIFCKCHLHNASNRFFWIPCTGTKVLFWQLFNYGKVALLNPCMEFKSFLGQKTSFTFSKVTPNMSQGPPNPGFMSVKVENWDFFKKDSQDLKDIG